MNKKLGKLAAGVAAAFLVTTVITFVGCTNEPTETPENDGAVLWGDVSKAELEQAFDVSTSGTVRIISTAGASSEVDTDGYRANTVEGVVPSGKKLSIKGTYAVNGTLAVAGNVELSSGADKVVVTAGGTLIAEPTVYESGGIFNASAGKKIELKGSLPTYDEWNLAEELAVRDASDGNMRSDDTPASGANHLVPPGKELYVIETFTINGETEGDNEELKIAVDNAGNWSSSYFGFQPENTTGSETAPAIIDPSGKINVLGTIRNTSIPLTSDATGSFAGFLDFTNGTLYSEKDVVIATNTPINGNIEIGSTKGEQRWATLRNSDEIETTEIRQPYLVLNSSTTIVGKLTVNADYIKTAVGVLPSSSSVGTPTAPANNLTVDTLTLTGGKYVGTSSVTVTKALNLTTGSTISNGSGTLILGNSSLDTKAASTVGIYTVVDNKFADDGKFTYDKLIRAIALDDKVTSAELKLIDAEISATGAGTLTVKGTDLATTSGKLTVTSSTGVARLATNPNEGDGIKVVGQLLDGATSSNDLALTGVSPFSLFEDTFKNVKFASGSKYSIVNSGYKGSGQRLILANNADADYSLTNGSSLVVVSKNAVNIAGVLTVNKSENTYLKWKILPSATLQIGNDVTFVLVGGAGDSPATEKGTIDIVGGGTLKLVSIGSVLEAGKVRQDVLNNQPLKGSKSGTITVGNGIIASFGQNNKIARLGTSKADKGLTISSAGFSADSTGIVIDSLGGPGTTASGRVLTSSI